MLNPHCLLCLVLHRKRETLSCFWPFWAILARIYALFGAFFTGLTAQWRPKMDKYQVYIYPHHPQVVQEYERAVIFRLGRLLQGGSKGPGLVPLNNFQFLIFDFQYLTLNFQKSRRFSAILYFQ